MEQNDYRITNANSTIKSNNDGKIKYDNDNPHYIQENLTLNQNENFSGNENFDLNNNVQSGAQTASNSVSGAIDVSTMTSTSVVSSGFGSIIGGVASSVATAIMVVAAFVSTMIINVSLVMAGTNSLVFQLEITGAQEEDFASQIYAVLSGEDYLQSQEIFADSIYLTFEGLQEGKEYTITIRNEEKIFVEKSYFTATDQEEKAMLSAWNEQNRVFAFVHVKELKSDEFYTLTATDGLGNVLFKASDVELEREFYFDVQNVNTVMLTLSVGGKVCCLQQISMVVEPEYDFDKGTWQWSDGYETASISFPDLNGGEPLVVEAKVETMVNEPDCETDGEIMFVASTMVNDKEYLDKKIKYLEATGHYYGEPVFSWDMNSDWPTATATFTCLNNKAHTEILEASVEIDEGSVDTRRFIATVEFNGEIYTDIYDDDGYLEDEPDYDYENPVWEWSEEYDWAYVSFEDLNGGDPLVVEASIEIITNDPDCETDGSITYIATAVVDGEEYNDEKVEELEATGHDYGEPVFEWKEGGNDGPTATATFTCINNRTHTQTVQASVALDEDSPNVVRYIATVVFNNKTYTDIYEMN